MKVLVTGGGGFLGSSICRQLAGLGHEIIAFQRRPAQHLAGHGVVSIEGDVSIERDLMDAADGCQAVVHTAGKASVWGDPAQFHRVNVTGTAHVLAACREHDIRFMVHTSSPSIVHSGGDISGADESLPIATEIAAPYPASKAEAERMVVAANSASLKTVALRPHLIWGPGDPHILPRLAAKVRNGKLSLPGPDKLIDTIFVENAALAHVKALEELTGDHSCAGKAYFVTNNQPMPQGEIITRLLDAIGIQVSIRAIPVTLAMAVGSICETAWRMLHLPSEPPVTRFAIEQLATAHWFDTSAAQRDFSYSPAISIEEGLSRLRKQGL